MAVHPKTIPRGPARDVDLDDPVQRGPVDYGQRVDPVVERIAEHIVQVEQEETAAAIHDGVNEADVIADLWIAGQIRNVVGRILQQEGRLVAPANRSGTPADKIRRFFGGRHRKRHANLEACPVSAGNCLKSEMLAVPYKRPHRLECVEHVQVRRVPTMCRADRKFNTVNNHGQRGAGLARAVHLFRHDFDGNPFPYRALPADCLGGNLDEVDEARPIQLRRQFCNVRKADS